MAVVPELAHDMNNQSGRAELRINFGGDPFLEIDVLINHAAHIGEVTM
jgi:hypothetical protein